MKYTFNSKEHLHLLDGKPLTGTTTILDVLGKPLTYWASGKACEVLGWTNEYTKDENGKRVKVPIEQRITHLKPVWQDIMKLDDAGVISLLDRAYKAHATNLKETAEVGTDMHAEMENYILDCISKNQGKPSITTNENKKVKDFATWSIENVEKFIGSEVYVYEEELFIGGIVDCVALMNDKSYAIIDFKSSKDAYFSQWIQVALYAIQLEKNGAFDENGNLLFKLDKPITKVVVIPFGSPKFITPEFNEKNIKTLQTAAISCVNIYRVKSVFEQ